MKEDRAASDTYQARVKLELKVNELTLHALSQDGLGTGEGYAAVLDLRRSHELESDPAPGFKEKNIPYYRMPIHAESLSEQDLDHLRRELARKLSPCAVVSSGGRRAAAIVLMHAGRTLGWKPEEALARCPEVKDDPVLNGQVESYLSRHTDKAARHWSREGL